MSKKEIIEVVFCNKFNKSNAGMALKLSKNIKQTIGRDVDVVLKHFYPLRKLAEYVKNEEYAVGVLAYRKIVDKGEVMHKSIMRGGVDIIDRHKLSIIDSARLSSGEARSLGMGVRFKDYLLLSNFTTFPKPSPGTGERWNTLMVADNVNHLSIVNINNTLSEQGICLTAQKTKEMRFYAEVDCHSRDLLKCLEELRVASINMRILGSYRLPEDKEKEEQKIRIQKEKRAYIKSITQPKKRRKDMGYFVK